MASVSHIPLSVLWLEPGKTHHGNWNNAPYDRVWAVTASPVAHQEGAVTKMQVTQIWEENNYDTGETEVHWMIKNIGSFGGYCFTFMSLVGP